MGFLLLHSLFYGAFLPFYNHFSTIFFLYYVDIAAILAVALALAWKQIASQFSKLGKDYLKYLALLMAAFIAIEILLVQPYHLLYNDEHIYMSMAKTMLYDHLFGICSFSTATHCVPGTLGFFHQPGEWPVLLAGAFGIFGASNSTAYALTLALATVSVALVFMVSYLIFADGRRALASGIAFASIPIFMSYSRTSMVDISALAALLLSIMMFIVYSRQRGLRTGIAAVFSLLFLLGTKADAAYALPILAAVLLLLGKGWLAARSRKRNLLKGIAVLAVAAVAVIPQLGFLYYAQQDSFGAAVQLGQAKFSLQNLNGNLFNNTVFWFGGLDSVRNSGAGVYSFTYHAYFPITVTIFAILGAVAMLAYGMRRELALLLAWFFVIFVFYTAYYAGNVAYGLGADIRYFMGCFAALSMLAGYGFVSAYDYLKRKASRRRKRNPVDRYVLMALFAILMSVPVLQFITITMQPPSAIASYAGERADESFLLANYQKVPANCTVITFKPPFWYMLGRSSIYTTWVNDSRYSGTLGNMTSCLYFDYDIDCYIGVRTGTVYGNTADDCRSVMDRYTMEDIASQNYSGYTWDTTWHLYRITGTKNASG